MKHEGVEQANQTSRFDWDSPGLEHYVLVSRKGTYVTHLCSGLQKAILVETEGITRDFPVFSIL